MERFSSGNTNCTFTRVNPSTRRRDEIKKFADISSGWIYVSRTMEILSPRRRTTVRVGNVGRPLERSRGRELAETSPSGLFPQGCKRRWQNPRLFPLLAYLRVIVSRNSFDSVYVCSTYANFGWVFMRIRGSVLVNIAILVKNKIVKLKDLETIDVNFSLFVFFFFFDETFIIWKINWRRWRQFIKCNIVFKINNTVD